MFVHTQITVDFTRLVEQLVTQQNRQVVKSCYARHEDCIYKTLDDVAKRLRSLNNLAIKNT